MAIDFNYFAAKKSCRVLGECVLAHDVIRCVKKVHIQWVSQGVTEEGTFISFWVARLPWRKPLKVFTWQQLLYLLHK